MRPPIVHILLVGEPFAGKSTFNRTMPTPNLVFFFDPIGKDVAYLECGYVQTEDKDGNPLLTPQKCPMTRVWRDNSMQELLYQLEYYHDEKWKDSTTSGLEPVPTAYENFCKRLITIDQEFDYWSTISLDSYSGLELADMLRHKYKINPGPKYDLRHWGGGARTDSEMIIFSRMGMFPTNVVVICHEKIWQDEKSGELIRQADTFGKLGNTFGRGFSEMYRMVNDPMQGRRLQTAKDALWNASSKYAPNPCDPSYQAVMKSWFDQQEAQNGNTQA